MKKLLVLYVFHIFNNRVKHFIDNCIFYDENVDFIIISNQNSGCPNPDFNGFTTENNIRVEVPDFVKILYRENIGFDFGGWSDALLINDLYKNYDNFIFVNSSVYGPFIPSDFSGKWTDKYIDGLQNNVKLFGSTINTICCPLYKSHVQSYIFAMNKETLQYLIDCGIFSITDYVKTFEDAVWNREVLMSRKIIENGWNIGSLFSFYKDVDFTFKEKKPEQYDFPFLDDIMAPNYRNVLWNDLEVVFIKGNRMGL